MRYVLMLMLTFLFPGLALSQTISVRSGEHAEFSRLVFEAPDALSWTLGRVSDGYLLRFQESGLEIDLARAFDKIGRARLTDVALEVPDRVHFSVAEEAYINAFDLRPGLLVVDIHDGSPPPDSPFEKMIGDASPANVLRLPLSAGRNPADPLVAPLLAPRPEVRNLTALRRDLFEQIGRAASQGLLGPVAPPVDPKGETPDPDLPRLVEEVPPAVDIPAHMQVETSIDSGLLAALSGNLREHAETACWPDAAVDVAAWYDDESPSILIGRHRAALYDGRDRPNRGAAKGLVKAYLALGFGAEAIAVLDYLDPNVPEAPLWRQMATIVDGGQATEQTPFDDQLSCPGAIAMWAALARPALAPDAQPDTAAIRRSFSALPLHLRHTLGPMLAERFLSAGDMITATAIRDAALRGEVPQNDPQLEIMKARIALQNGEVDQADKTVAQLASSGSVSAAEALVLRLETYTSAQKTPTVEDVLSAESLAFELRGTPLGGRLSDLAIGSHGLQRSFDAAFAMLSERPSESVAALADTLIEQLATNGTDADILLAVFGGGADVAVAAAGAHARVTLAHRMVGLGFMDEADRLIGGLAGLHSAEARQVLAEIALTREAPGQAVQYLADLETPQAASLRARARAMLGDFEGAANAAGAAGQVDRAADFAWRGQEWAAIREIGNPAQKALVEARNTPQTQGPSLASARNALLQSSEVRMLLSTLLAPETEAAGQGGAANVQSSSTGAP